MAVWQIIHDGVADAAGVKQYVTADLPLFDDGEGFAPGAEGFSRDAIDAHLAGMEDGFLANYQGQSPASVGEPA